MRKLKKQEMLNSIATLMQVNDTIAVNNNLNIEAVINALTDCQQLAISIGSNIEEYHNEHMEIVRILEEYCEEIYNMCMGISDSSLRFKLAKKIQKKLLNINNKVKYDLPDDRKEVVFLPYKASMWDSLESVWKKKKMDANYDVYVIPVPYYDKNADGTMGEMHYEGNEYPDYVSITSYEEYSIADRRPDEIYIHNPYDGCNKITTIHPDFYAKELRKYTDMLIYIPYFVAINDNVDRHFCTMPGVMYAHKVIVQSEKVREIYIDEFHKLEEEFKCRDAFGVIEEKIIVGGSPKFDKVMEAKLEDFDIPESWDKLIVKKDGKRKRVILYNTTIKPMLTNPEGMLKKIENVFKTFKANPEVVLLWRPHPLLKTSLKSMRKEYSDFYERLENKYISEGWGIYDNTADMYRAITLSDAYYGDNSSVVELYKRTGKPIMLQNINV